MYSVTNYGGHCIQTNTMPKLGNYCVILIFLYENKCIVRTLSKYRIPTQWLTAYPNRKHLSQVILSWQCYLTSYFLVDIGWVVYKVSGLIPTSSSLHVELSLGMTLNPKLDLVYPWVCTWILELVNVAIQGEVHVSLKQHLCLYKPCFTRGSSDVNIQVPCNSSSGIYCLVHVCIDTKTQGKGLPQQLNEYGFGFTNKLFLSSGYSKAVPPR